MSRKLEIPFAQKAFARSLNKNLTSIFFQDGQVEIKFKNFSYLKLYY